MLPAAKMPALSACLVTTRCARCGRRRQKRRRCRVVSRRPV